MRYHIDLRRCAFGAGSQGAGGAGNFGFVGLFNDAPGGELLAVHDIGNGNSPTVSQGFSITRGSIGTKLASATPVWIGTGAPAGSIYTGSGAFVSPITLFNALTNVSPQWVHEYPLIIVPAGWQLTAWATTANAIYQAGFWWQVCTNADLIGVDEPPTLIIPKILKLTLETE